MSDQEHEEEGQAPWHKTDKQYLTTRQYRDARNLNARGSLHARFGSNPYPWFRWLFDQLLAIAPAEARILEVGCGPAGLWVENLDRLPPGWRVTLTDLSGGMVATARERLAAAGAPADTFTIQTADVESLPFADANFDVAIANHMLYHVPDRPKALGELRRVLRTGGALLAATNGEENMRELDELLLGFAPDARDREWKASFRHPFKLENGAEQLAPFFDYIEMDLYVDSLRVTDEDALVAYALSIDIPGLREPDQQDAFATHVHERMAAQGGVITITKSVGAFIARLEPRGQVSLDQIVTRRDFAVYIHQLVKKQADYDGALEEYLRSVLSAVSAYQDVQPTFHIQAQILTDAFSIPPLPFDPAWLGYTNPPEAVTQDDSANTDSFGALLDMLRYQIADLHRMAEAGILDNPYRSMGVESPTGNSWYNFDPESFLACAFGGIVDTQNVGHLSDEEDGSERSWTDLAIALWLGQIYE